MSKKRNAAPFYWHASRRQKAIKQIVIRKADVLGVEELRYIGEIIRILAAGQHGLMPVSNDDVIERLTDWVSQYAPGAFSPNAIEAAAKAAMKGSARLAKDEEVGEAFEVTYDEYVAWGLVTIQPMDCSRKELERRNKRRWYHRKLERRAQKRREQGKPTRAQWRAEHSVSASKPWIALGMKERTWYRNGKPMPGDNSVPERFTGAMAEVGAIHGRGGRGRWSDNLNNHRHQPLPSVASSSTAPRGLHGEVPTTRPSKPQKPSERRSPVTAAVGLAQASGGGAQPQAKRQPPPEPGPTQATHDSNGSPDNGSAGLAAPPLVPNEAVNITATVSSGLGAIQTADSVAAPPLVPDQQPDAACMQDAGTIAADEPVDVPDVGTSNAEACRPADAPFGSSACSDPRSSSVMSVALAKAAGLAKAACTHPDRPLHEIWNTIASCEECSTGYEKSVQPKLLPRRRGYGRHLIFVRKK